MTKYKNAILAPPSMEQKLMNSRYNKEIVITSFMPNDEMIYISKTGAMRMIKDNKIWEHICDSNGFPTGYARVKRKLK